MWPLACDKVVFNMMQHIKGRYTHEHDAKYPVLKS